MSPRELSDHERANQAAWDEFAADYVQNARENWATDEVSWGMYGIPEAKIGILPDVDGLDLIDAIVGVEAGRIAHIGVGIGFG